MLQGWVEKYCHYIWLLYFLNHLLEAELSLAHKGVF